ncbi:glycosyltransferase [Thiohalorhabdus sp. Cl-TMA]|uniref:Glycosyltransferase n=1 Tax=Thiohalorhabdus methylotrophus TaxID=3242694 RepID=A0ABV4TTA2_9GAMM
MSGAPSRRIAIFLSFSGDGGVEHMMVNLAGAIARLGFPVDLVRIRVEGGHATRIPEGVRVVDLKARHTWSSLPALVRYLRRERPAALLAAKDRANRIALRARRIAGVSTRIAVRLGNNLSRSLEGRSRLRKWARTVPMRRAYHKADAVIAVSAGVAEDTAAITGLPRRAIQVLPNPVVTPDLEERARPIPEHPWLRDQGEKDPPLILGVGRLSRQKDFPTLLRAFARLTEEQSARLVVLGEGRDRAELEGMAARLGISGLVDFPGFAANPYPYMQRADLFALSSAWEGSPNALTEALALGTPVVATDCPSGPREILEEGRYGALVPVGDAPALAEAMAETLRAPLSPEFLRSGGDRYRDTESARRYLEVLGVPDAG